MLEKICFWPLLLLALLPSAPAWAGNCQPVDLRDRFGPAMHQAETGLCFAHAAAELVSFRVGRPVSPLDLARQYLLGDHEMVRRTRNPAVRDFLRRNPNFINVWRLDRAADPEYLSTDRILTVDGLMGVGGEEAPTILAANVFGLCALEDLPDGKEAYDEYINSINVYHRTRLERKEWSDWETVTEIGGVTEPMARVAARSFARWVDGRCRRRFAPREPLLPEGLAFAESARAFQLMVAGGKIDPGKTRRELFAKIDANLSRGQPVSVGYDASDLFDPALSPPAKLRATADDEEAVLHASIIVARREINGECFYFVRNTYGEEHEDYYPQFKARFERGGTWVRPEEVPSLYSAVWLK